MPELAGIPHVTMSVVDLATSRWFCTEVMGLPGRDGVTELLPDAPRAVDGAASGEVSVAALRTI